MEDILLQLLTELDKISHDHDEIFDTSVRESLHSALLNSLSNFDPTALPQDYAKLYRPMEMK